MKASSPPLLLLLGFGLAFSLLSPAEEPPKRRPYTVGPDEAVTPSRFAADRFKAPFLVEVIGPEELGTGKAPRTVPDALKGVAGVNAQRTAHGQGSPYLRGVTGYHTLFLIDGFRLNNATFRSGPNQYWTTVDPLSIDRLEVVKGPAAVLYGSDAIGGTVNALTISPPEGSGEGFHVREHGRWASAEDALVYRQEFSGLFGRLGFVGGASLKHFGDLKSGNGTLPNTGYGETDGDLKIVYDWDKLARLTFAAQRVEQDNAPRTHATVESRSYKGTLTGGDIQRELDQRRDLVYLKGQFPEMSAIADEGEIGVAFHEQREVQDRLRGPTERLEVRAYRDLSLGCTAQLRKETDLGLWTYGGEHYRDLVESSGEDYNPNGLPRLALNQGQVADDARYDLSGVFVQDEIRLGETPWTLTPGVRHTRARTKANTVEIHTLPTQIMGSWENTSGSLRARYDLTKDWHLFGGTSQGFRAPNLSDLTRFDVARSGETEIPVRELDPEEFLQHEIGTKVRAKGWEVQAACYYTEIRNFIDRVPTGNLIGTSREVRKENTGDGWIQGAEVSGWLDLEASWRLSGAAGWQAGAVETFVTSESASKERRPMSKMPPASATLAVRWTEPSEKRLWIEPSVTVTRAQHRLSPADKLDVERIPPGGSPGYEILTVRAGWKLAGQVTLGAAVENVADVDHRAHGSGVNEPGRSYVLSIEARY